MGTYGDCREIAVLLRQEALRCGVGKAGKVVFIGDGAAWIWKNCQLTFPEAVQILDYYHASEYVVEIARAVHEGDKQSGMFWSEQGAQNILGLRCLMLGPHFEAAWEIRRKLLEEKRRKARRWLPAVA